MKKFLVLSLFSMLIMGVHAQGKVELGLKGGLSLTDIEFSKPKDADYGWNSKMDIGFAYGIYGKLKLIDKLSFQAEFYFANKRYIREEEDSEKDYDVTISERHHSHLNEWEIPMLLTYDIKKIANKYDLYVLLGPALSFVKGDGSSTKLTAQKYYWNGMGGVGLKYGRFAADLRYERNLYDFYKNTDGETDMTLNANVISLNVSFNFLGKRELKREYKRK